MEVIAEWEDRGKGGWKYKFPGVQGFVRPDRRATSIVSSSSALIQEVNEVAFALRVQLPKRWALVVRRQRWKSKTCSRPGCSGC